MQTILNTGINARLGAGLGARRMRPLPALDTFNVAQRISAALKRAFGDMSAPIKRCARLSGSDMRAARNHWDGVNCPRAPELIRMMRECDDVYLEILEMAGRDDPDALAALLNQK